jgi:flavin-dependent dehydrogenase
MQRYESLVVDVLIVGGGVAGSTLAILLGRCGFSVELLERGHFPREKQCGEGLMPAGVAVLERLGLAETVGGVPFYGVRYHFDEYTAEGCFPHACGHPHCRAGTKAETSRQGAVRNGSGDDGCESSHRTRMDAPLCENGHITGVLVHVEPMRDRLVVAADGVHSRIRHYLGLDAESSRKRFGIRVHYRLGKGQEQPPWVDVFLASGHELYVTPLPHREVLVAALTDIGHAEGPILKHSKAGYSLSPYWRRDLRARSKIPNQCAHPGLPERRE